MAEGYVAQTIELTDADIPGAHLEEPLDSHNVAALRWWLVCRGMKPSSTLRKQELIKK
jgi:hypothetical protein